MLAGLAVYLQQAYVAKAGQAPQPIDTNPAFQITATTCTWWRINIRLA